MRYRFSAIVLVAMTVAGVGCASAPSPGTDLPVFREVDYANEGYALLVIYRDARRYASYNLMPISCDGAPLIQLPVGAAVQYFALPGRRTIAAGMAGNVKGTVRTASLVVDVRAGQRYFVKVVPSMGLVTIDITLLSVRPEIARTELGTLKGVVGPRGELAMVEKAPRPAPSVPARPGGSRVAREEATGNVPKKLATMLGAGTKVSLIVVAPEKDISYHGPPLDIPLPEWRVYMASGVISQMTGDLLRNLGEVPAFSVVNRENVRDILKEFELQGSAAFDRTETARVGRMVGANYMLLLSFSREHISGSLYRESTGIKLVDMERNTILALDTLTDDLDVDVSTQSASIRERRLNGRRYELDPADGRSYFVE